MGTKKKTIKNMHSPAQVERNALLRFEMACDLMVGPGHFRKFTKICHKRLLHFRFDAVKMKFNGAKSAEENKLIEHIFKERLAELAFKVPDLGEMPLSLFLREGLVLSFYVEAAKDDPHMQQLAPLFQGYFIGEELLKLPLTELVFLLHRMSIILSDWSKHIFVYSMDELAAYSGKPQQNYVKAEYLKLESRVVKFAEHKREVIRLSWSGVYGEPEYASVLPSKIGLKGFGLAGDEEPLPVFIQKHALMRLQERLGMLPGLLHHEIFELFNDGDFVFHRNGRASLVEFKMWGKKLGYLYCGVTEGIVVIRSFLFLTNDNTPEGKRLSEMTQLQRLDKSFLRIDTLAGFRSFKIAEDAELSALFTEAGCEDLLDLTQVEPYCMDAVKEKDLMMLLKYMMGAGRKAEELV